MKQNSFTITVIGSGAVGGALIHFIKNSSYSLRSIWNRAGGIVFQEDGSEVMIASSLPVSKNQIGDLVILAVPDDAISTVTSKLSKKDFPWETKSVIHCSGNLSSDVLLPLDECGCSTASMHPIQTFKRGDKSDRFRNIFISLEGDSDLIETLTLLVRKMDAKELILTPQQKSSLHIAAVLSSNYVVALMHQAKVILENAGVSDGIELLEPLIRQTIQNIFDKGTVEALTGPISRGDVKSVNKHVKELRTDEKSLQVYRILGEIAAQITNSKGELSTSKIDQIMAALRSDDT